MPERVLVLAAIPNIHAIELASGHKKDRVPFATLHANMRQFIDPKYHPKDFTFGDPRNIKKDVILNFCQHVRSRQEEHGVPEAFRFLRYQNGKDRVVAEYGTRADEERAAAKALKQKDARAVAKKRRQGNVKGKQKATNNQPVGQGESSEPIGDMPSDSGTSNLPQKHPNRENESPTVTGMCVIDPALLGYMQAEALGSTLGTVSTPGPLLIDELDMERLKAIGHPASIPVNGPNDGPPMYSVPASAWALLESHGTNESDHNDSTGFVADNSPHTMKRKASKKNADARAIEEAQALLSEPARGRGRKNARRK